jgi:Protein of unknown function (DUF3037)
MTEFVCNYAVARFRPYRETSEFINVGIVLLCPELDYFGYRFETRKHKRITDFFPELDINIFKAGLSGMQKELGRVPTTAAQGQFILKEEVSSRLAAFQELVRIRETVFHFGEVGTVLAAEPNTKLTELFKFYVERQFARDRDYQELIMKRELGQFLQKIKMAAYYKQDEPVGDDTYKITLPFVHYKNSKPRKALKPLHLAKDATTEIYRHGDAWVSTLRRLNRIKRRPDELLFTVKQPTGEKQRVAATEICEELRRNNGLVVDFKDAAGIERFARI